MKFIAAISTVLLWSHPAISTSPPPEEYYDGFSHGTDVARYLWKQGGSTCSNIWTYEDTVSDYLEEHYPLDTGNWMTDSFNAGVEAGADQFVEQKEAKCLNESPEECNDLGLGAAQQIAYTFCPINVADATSGEEEPNYKEQCMDVAEGICEGAIYGFIQENGCSIKTSELSDLQDQCDEQIKSMLGIVDDDGGYIPPVIENCSDGWDCESCLSNSKCTWFQDIGYCETGCGMEGCGATVCPSDLDTCETCLGGSDTPASGQYSWSPEANECLTDCSVIADASCYKAKSSLDPTGYDPSICEEIANTIDQCSEGHDCESCLSNSECTWFAELGYCETMCGQHGCGASVCAAEITTCEECLGGSGTDASGQYSWSPYTNECVEDCMFAPADAPCFKAKSSLDPTGYDPSICDEINNTHGKSVIA